MSGTTPEYTILIPRATCLNCGQPSGHMMTVDELSQPLSLLRSNFIPSLSQIEPIRRSINKRQEDIHILDNEISLLRSVLSQLERHRENLHTYVTNQRCLISPIRRLPVEVLGEIFLECSSSVSVCDPQSFVRIVRQVCVHWREIALSLPTLWSKIDVDLKAFGPSGLRPRNMPRLIEMIGPFVEFCVFHSGNVPFSFSVSRVCTPKFFGDSALLTLAMNSSRWESISLSFELLTTLLRLSEGPVCFLMLKSLDIISDNTEIEWLDALEDSPQLSSLTLRNFSHPFNRLVIPWAQIQQFKVDDTQFLEDELIELIESMPKLEFFEFSGESTSLGTDSITAIRLPFLRSLRITSESSAISQLLQLVTTPKLVDLSLNCTSNTFSAFQVTHFLRRSRCTIRKLSVSNISLLHEAYDVLELCPNVTHFDLDVSKYAEGDLQVLSVQRYLPRMHTFNLSCRISLPIDVFLEILRSRTVDHPDDCDMPDTCPTSHLRFVALRLGQELDPSELRELKNFVKNEVSGAVKLEIHHDLRRKVLRLAN